MFDLDPNNNVIIKEPVILNVKEFKVIWDRDKTKNKSQANKEFSYLYLKNDFKSPYRNSYSKEEITDVLKRDLGFDDDWKESEITSSFNSSRNSYGANY